MSLIDRQQRLRRLLELESVVWRWSIKLGRGDADRIAALRRYLISMAEIEVGLAREIRRGWIAEDEVVLVVDEYAEALHAIRRPPLSARTEREIKRQIASVVRRPERSIT